MLVEDVSQLIELAPKFPLETLECLELIVKGDTRGLIIEYLKNEIHTILETAMQGDIPRSYESGERIINYLGSRGYFSFGELLKKKKAD